MHPTLLRLTLLGLVLTAPLAQAQALSTARAEAAQSRAESHVRQFPGLSLDGANHSYQVRDVVVDDDGSTHVRMDRTVGGLRVIGGDLVVQNDRNGNLAAMHHNLRWRVDVASSLR